MTAPTAPVVESAAASGPIPDDVLGAALTARAERNQRALFDDDDPAPPDAPATPASGEAPAAADASTGSDAAPKSPATPDGTDQPDAPDTSTTPDPIAALVETGNPFTYTVNKTAKPFDGIVDLGERGAFVRPDAVGRLKDTIQRAEHATEANRALYQQVQTFEQLGGVAKFHETAERNAQLNASALHIMEAVFNNPRQFVNDDGTPNQHALELLRREAKAAAQEAQWSVRTERTTAAEQATVSQRDAEVRQTAIPSFLSEQFPALHPEDRALLEQQGARFLFTVTPETAAQYGQPVGTLMIDADAIKANATHMQTLRAAAKAETERREKAAAENARRTATPPAPRPKSATTTQPRRKDGTFAEAKAAPRLSPSEIFERSLAGQAIGQSFDE